jgi:predicted Zn-dependent protease
MQFGIRSRVAALFLAAALSGCAQSINPVTGKSINPWVSTATETFYGQQLHAKMVASHGAYQDAALSAYVDRVGQALAKNVVRKDLKYTFTILDDDDINAFALPGGYVYITRGALNYSNSEAELAAVLGHEIGHVDAFHFNRRNAERDDLKSLLAVLVRRSSHDQDELAVAQQLADESKKASGYSQDQEFEADALGIHYMALAGYDPQGMVAALRTEDAKMKLDDGGMKGNPIAHDIFALDQSHPATPEREARAVAAANVAVLAPGTGPKTDRDAYLAAIDGMTFGADTADGTVEGRRFVNTDFGFGFEAPEDFDLWTGHGGGFGIGRNAMLVIETTEEYTGQSLVTYVQSMADDVSIGSVHPLDIDGYRGATGVAHVDPFIIRVGAVHDRDKHLYKLMYVAHRSAFDDLDPGFLESLKSFRPLDGDEARPRPAPRLSIVTVAGGDTVKILAARMALKEQKLEWFRLLNGLAASDEVKPGDKVKLVE